MTTDPPDGALVKAALGGDRAAFGTLVERHRGWVRNMMLARTGDFDRAEEAAQEAFVRAFTSLPTLRDPDAFRGWLRTLSERVATDQGRRRTGSSEMPEVPVRDGASPPEREERRSAVAKAVEALEEPYREAVVLRYDQGLSCSEIARALGVSPAAVSMRLSRAHEALSKALSEWGTP